MALAQTLAYDTPTPGETAVPLTKTIDYTQTGDLLGAEMTVSGAGIPGGSVTVIVPAGALWNYSVSLAELGIVEYLPGEVYTFTAYYMTAADSKQWVTDHWEFTNPTWDTLGPATFTTYEEPGQASNPDPADEDPNIPVTVTDFSWTIPDFGDDTFVKFEVYLRKIGFGSSKIGESFVGTDDSIVYAGGDLDPGEDYEWWIYYVYSVEGVKQSPIWTFSTVADPSGTGTITFDKSAQSGGSPGGPGTGGMTPSINKSMSGSGTVSLEAGTMAGGGEHVIYTYIGTDSDLADNEVYKYSIDTFGILTYDSHVDTPNSGDKPHMMVMDDDHLFITTSLGVYAYDHDLVLDTTWGVLGIAAATVGGVTSIDCRSGLLLVGGDNQAMLLDAADGSEVWHNISTGSDGGYATGVMHTCAINDDYVWLGSHYGFGVYELATGVPGPALGNGEENDDTFIVDQVYGLIVVNSDSSTTDRLSLYDGTTRTTVQAIGSATPDNLGRVQPWEDDGAPSQYGLFGYKGNLIIRALTTSFPTHDSYYHGTEEINDVATCPIFGIAVGGYNTTDHNVVVVARGATSTTFAYALPQEVAGGRDLRSVVMHVIACSEPIVITKQTGSMRLRTSESVNLQVWATGMAVLKYSWYKNGLIIPGATSDTYTVNMISSGNGHGTYHCAVSNFSCPSVQSNDMAVAWTNRGRLRQNLFMEYGDMNDIAQPVIHGSGAASGILSKGTMLGNIVGALAGAGAGNIALSKGTMLAELVAVPTTLTHIDSNATGVKAYGVHADADYVYLADNTGGFVTFTVDGSGNLTRKDGDVQPGNAFGVYSDANFVYLANWASGIEVYSVAGGGTGIITHESTMATGGNARKVTGDGTYIFAACRAAGVRVYSVDGVGVLTLEDFDTLTSEAQGIHWDGTFLYVCDYTTGIHTYSVDGAGQLTHLDSDNIGPTRGAAKVGGFLAVAGHTSGVHTYSVDGGGLLTHVDVDDEVSDCADVWSDGTYLFVARTLGGLQAYSVDGSGMLSQIDVDDPGDQAYDISGYGDYIFLAEQVGGLHSYKFE